MVARHCKVLRAVTRKTLVCMPVLVVAVPGAQVRMRSVLCPVPVVLVYRATSLVLFCGMQLVVAVHSSMQVI